jgi:hypothetical protein
MITESYSCSNLGKKCSNGECVNNTPVCTPNCAGKYCGSDGCGGSCGTCSAGYVCISDRYCAGESPSEPPVESLCVDTDSGFSIFSSGTAFGKSPNGQDKVIKDYCKTSRILVEGYCSMGRVVSREVNCLEQGAKGCQAGKCTFKLDPGLR